MQFFQPTRTVIKRFAGLTTDCHANARRFSSRRTTATSPSSFNNNNNNNNKVSSSNPAIGRVVVRPAAAPPRLSPTAPKVGFSTAYIHPLSQLVLQHLQHYYHPWVKAHALDHVVLRPDGTFVLGGGSSSTQQQQRVGTVCDAQGHWLQIGNVPTASQHHQQQQQRRYLLQDNNNNNNGRQRRENQSITERVKESVRWMVQTMEDRKNGVEERQ